MPCDRRLLRYSVRSFRPTRSPDERSLCLVLATTAERCYMSVIAVVITLDRPETASCCLSSILHGSQRPDRVVVVDNGSTVPYTSAGIPAGCRCRSSGAQQWPGRRCSHRPAEGTRAQSRLGMDARRRCYHRPRSPGAPHTSCQNARRADVLPLCMLQYATAGTSFLQLVHIQSPDWNAQTSAPGTLSGS